MGLSVVYNPEMPTSFPQEETSGGQSPSQSTLAVKKAVERASLNKSFVSFSFISYQFLKGSVLEDVGVLLTNMMGSLFI